MPNNAQLRLRPVLEILADAAANGTRPDAREVISEALRRVPPTAHEQELRLGHASRRLHEERHALVGLEVSGVEHDRVRGET